MDLRGIFLGHGTVFMTLRHVFLAVLPEDVIDQH